MSVTASAMFVTIILESLGKNFIKNICPKHFKIINWNRKLHIFLYHTSFLKVLRRPGVENKNIMSLPPAPFSPYPGLRQQGLRLSFCRIPDLYHFQLLNNRYTKQNLKHKTKPRLLAHYTNLFSASNIWIFSLLWYHNILLSTTRTLF